MAITLELTSPAFNRTLGSSANDCVVYNYQTNETPLITSTGPAVVTLANFKLIGGWFQSWYMPSDWYKGFSPRGITSTNATLSRR